MSFELELLRIGQDGTTQVTERIDCHHGLALAKVMAEDVLRERRKNGGSVDAVRVIDIDGAEVFRSSSGTPGQRE